MKYRIRARSYRAYGGRPYDWQSGGLYDIEAAIQIMQRMYTIDDVLTQPQSDGAKGDGRSPPLHHCEVVPLTPQVSASTYPVG